jgi:ketosteroid isomerase-like protein
MPDREPDALRVFLESWDPLPELSAWKRGEVPDVFDRDVAYEDSILPDHAGETYRGIEGIIRATERWTEPFDSVSQELVAIHGEGDRRVSIHRLRMHAHHTGLDLETEAAYLWELRDGKVVWFKTFNDAAQAKAAAGLREAPAAPLD